MKKKTFLVTGGTGFIGSHISELLVKKNFKVKVYDDNSLGSIKNISTFRNKVKFIHGDVRDKKLLNKSLKNVNAVVHLAYVNGTKHFYDMPVKILDIAVKGMINVIEGCIENNIKEIYLASTAEVFQTAHKIPTSEEESLKIPDVHNPRYSYACGKILHEVMGVHYGKKYFKKLVIFRPYNIYGPRMGKDHVIPDFIQRLKTSKGKYFKIQGTGKEIRSFCYIDDFIKAFDLLLQKGKHLNIYNIGTSEKIKIKDLALKISKISKRKILIQKTPLTRGSTKIRVPNISKIKKIGFRPKFNLDKGLRKSIV
jgi:nucleoside-diphosphate-sugar epimerase